MARLRGQKLFNTALIGAVFVVVLDRLAKSFSLEVWQRGPRILLDDFLSLGFLENTTIAFSLPLPVPPTFIALPIIFVAAYYFWRQVHRKKQHEAAALAFIILGAASNLYDRLAYGYVIDYIDVHYFTVFNLADTMICFGVAWLLWRLSAAAEVQGELNNLDKEIH